MVALAQDTHQMLGYRLMAGMHADVVNERRCVKYEKYP